MWLTRCLATKGNIGRLRSLQGRALATRAAKGSRRVSLARECWRWLAMQHGRPTLESPEIHRFRNQVTEQ
eukprot:1539766-Alexandrium_andersonii.AAC.1